MPGPIDSFCGSPFWEHQLTWNTTNPDFAPCFHHTVLVWVPCGFLWFFAPLETYNLIKSPDRNIPWTGLNIVKTIVAAVLALLSLIDMSYGVHRYVALGEQVPSVHYYAPFIKLMTFLLIICFIQAGRKRGIQSSGVQFLFWFLLTLAGVFTYRSHLDMALNKLSIPDDFTFGTYMIYFPLVFSEFIMAFMSDARPQYREHYPIDEENECPEHGASFVSKMLYSWFNSLALLGWKRALVKNDLWSLNYEDRTESVVPKFDKYWKQQCLKQQTIFRSAEYKPGSGAEVQIKPGEKKVGPNVMYALAKAFGPFFLSGAIFKVVQDVLQFASPLILKLLIAFVSPETRDPLWKGILYAILLFLAASTQSICLGVYFHRMMIVGLRIRTALISAIYRKSLALSNEAKKESTLGEIVNLMSVDAQRFMDLMTFLNLIWSAPFQIILAVYFLWGVLGPSVLAGLGVMILMIPLNGVIANQAKKYQMKQMKNKDERTKVMNEVLNGMKVLKLYAWEISFQRKIIGIRDKEMDLLRKIAYLNSCGIFLWTCAPFLVSLVSFATYVMVDSEQILTAEIAFVSLTLFNILRFPLTLLPHLVAMIVTVSLVSFATFVFVDDSNILDAERAFVALSLFHLLRFPLALLPMLITMIVQASVSLKRINRYLGSQELEPYVTHEKGEIDPIVMDRGTFTWARDEPAVLKNVDFHVPHGSLVAVVGTVGSGKSSLLSAVLGDMERIEGRVNIKGSVAYVAQQAWIQNATLKDNILFSRSLDQSKYDNVIEACSLKTDFEMLPGGDHTEIGEKGINLSGGQKQRVSVARAVYSDADIYLLDDPLSAVDSHVGKHIFEKVIGPSGILCGKTRVLVTHGISFLPQMDRIVVMKDGSVLETGSYQELLAKKGAFAEFLIQHLQEEREDVEENMDVVEEIIQKVGSPELERQLSRALSESERHSSLEKKASFLRSRSVSRQLSQESLQSQRSHSRSIHEKSDSMLLNGLASIAADDKEGTKLIQTETAETGEVKMDVYLRYFKAVSYMWTVSVLVTFVGQQAFSVGSNVWLSEWSNDKPVNGTQDISKRDLRLGVYGGLGLGQGLTILFGSFALSLGTLQASGNLHNDLLLNILKSPMSFFDTTPLGRVVNRFAKDVDTVDTTIPMTLRSWLSCVLQVFATLIIICIQTPIFLAVIVPVGGIYYFIQKFYVASSRQLKRLESVTRSPIYSHFSETLAGVSSIRAFGAKQRFKDESANLVDINQVCYYPSIIANRWLAIRLEFCGNILVFFAALFAVLGRDSLSPGTVGLSVSYALSVTATMNWMVRMSSELETNIVSVERISEYTTTPTEAAWEIESAKPDPAWPQSGQVTFDKYSTRYREGLDLVVKGISCVIKPGEKVGIVGRTGAGKSSLTLSLFRLIEAASGSIVIDGIDIAKIGLHDLRSRLTIIPQDPVLFSGTLRLNLDPFVMYTDEEVWKALEQSHLKGYVTSLEAGLEHEVSEGGENLSVGQRQLVCLARALLRKTKVLVLDEATAAVDLDTDDLIQATIRKEFAECSVLTIAHRLNTIMDSNRVMVLDKGEIVEFDSPANLLQNKESIFYSMAKDAGLV